jgi:alpha-ketoglutarate-dependent taurine dioxygenase
MITYPFESWAADYLSNKQITLGYLRPDSPLPLVVRPSVQGIDLIGWAACNRALIEGYLLRNGAVLFRDFDLSTVGQFEQLIKAAAGPLLDQSFRSPVGKILRGKIYSSTEYPSHQAVPLYNENSFARSWPMKLALFSMQVAETGGEAILADCRKIYQAIPAEIRDCFVRKGLTYVRNYGDGRDLSWQEIFQTTSKAVVEAYCHKAQLEFEWIGNDQIRTKQRAQAVEAHPRSGELIWFNQAHLFHVSRSQVEVREWLLSGNDEDNLPRSIYFGDDSRIETAMLDEIVDVHDRLAIVFQWRKGDVLLIDNMLTAHGRRRFTGSRKLAVGIAESNRTINLQGPGRHILRLSD